MEICCIPDIFPLCLQKEPGTERFRKAPKITSNCQQLMDSNDSTHPEVWGLIFFFYSLI